MALWGNNDNKGSGGTVTLNYSTLEVVGSGTTFGQVGAATTGDIIRFGFRGAGGTYFGDAVVVGIASTTTLTIGSTAGLSGAAIAATSFYISELPKYTVLDSTYSNINDAGPSFVPTTYSATATTIAGVGTNIIPVVVVNGVTGVVIGDALINGGNNIRINTIDTTTISLASTISAGIATGDTLRFARLADGYDKQVYGISTTSDYVGAAYTGFTHQGWVGIMTYMGTEGEMRVRSEVLVAMSGITTGSDGILYPTPV
jgi:hypothetical protein